MNARVRTIDSWEGGEVDNDFCMSELIFKRRKQRISSFSNVTSCDLGEHIFRCMSVLVVRGSNSFISFVLERVGKAVAGRAATGGALHRFLKFKIQFVP